jgi:hypothetical protein
MNDPIELVVLLWIYPGKESAFEAFESRAAQIMAQHGGRIENARSGLTLKDHRKPEGAASGLA